MAGMKYWMVSYGAEEESADIVLIKDVSVEQFKADCVEAYVRAFEDALKQGWVFRRPGRGIFEGPFGDCPKDLWDKAVDHLMKMGYRAPDLAYTFDLVGFGSLWKGGYQDDDFQAVHKAIHAKFTLQDIPEDHILDELEGKKE